MLARRLAQSAKRADDNAESAAAVTQSSALGTDAREALMKPPMDRTEEEVDALVREFTQRNATPFFQELPDPVLRELCRFMEFETVHRGRILFRQGEVGTKFYVVLYGGVLVWADMTDKQTQLTPLELRASAAKQHLDGASMVALQDDAARAAKRKARQDILMERKEREKEAKHRASAMWSSLSSRHSLPGKRSPARGSSSTVAGRQEGEEESHKQRATSRADLMIRQQRQKKQLARKASQAEGSQAWGRVGPTGEPQGGIKFPERILNQLSEQRNEQQRNSPPRAPPAQREVGVGRQRSHRRPSLSTSPGRADQSHGSSPQRPSPGRRPSVTGASSHSPALGAKLQAVSAVRAMHEAKGAVKHRARGIFQRRVRALGQAIVQGRRQDEAAVSQGHAARKRDVHDLRRSVMTIASPLRTRGPPVVHGPPGEGEAGAEGEALDKELFEGGGQTFLSRPEAQKQLTGARMVHDTLSSAILSIRDVLGRTERLATEIESTEKFAAGLVQGTAAASALHGLLSGFASKVKSENRVVARVRNVQEKLMRWCEDVVLAVAYFGGDCMLAIKEGQNLVAALRQVETLVEDLRRQHASDMEDDSARVAARNRAARAAAPSPRRGSVRAGAPTQQPSTPRSGTAAAGEGSSVLGTPSPATPSGQAASSAQASADQYSVWTASEGTEAQDRQQDRDARVQEAYVSTLSGVRETLELMQAALLHIEGMRTSGGFKLPKDGQGRVLSPLGLRMAELLLGDTFGELALYAVGCRRSATVMGGPRTAVTELVSVSKEVYDRSLRNLHLKDQLSLVSFFEHIAPFDAWPRAKLLRLVYRVKSHKLPHGAALGRPGQPLNCISFVRKGEVRIAAYMALRAQVDGRSFKERGALAAVRSPPGRHGPRRPVSAAEGEGGEEGSAADVTSSSQRRRRPTRRRARPPRAPPTAAAVTTVYETRRVGAGALVGGEGGEAAAPADTFAASLASSAARPSLNPLSGHLAREAALKHMVRRGAALDPGVTPGRGGASRRQRPATEHGGSGTQPARSSSDSSDGDGGDSGGGGGPVPAPSPLSMQLFRSTRDECGEGGALALDAPALVEACSIGAGDAVGLYEASAGEPRHLFLATAQGPCEVVELRVEDFDRFVRDDAVMLADLQEAAATRHRERMERMERGQRAMRRVATDVATQRTALTHAVTRGQTAADRARALLLWVPPDGRGAPRLAARDAAFDAAGSGAEPGSVDALATLSGHRAGRSNAALRLCLDQPEGPERRRRLQLQHWLTANGAPAWAASVALVPPHNPLVPRPSKGKGGKGAEPGSSAWSTAAGSMWFACPARGPLSVSQSEVQRQRRVAAAAEAQQKEQEAWCALIGAGRAQPGRELEVVRGHGDEARREEEEVDDEVITRDAATFADDSPEVQEFVFAIREAQIARRESRREQMAALRSRVSSTEARADQAASSLYEQAMRRDSRGLRQSTKHALASASSYAQYALGRSQRQQQTSEEGESTPGPSFDAIASAQLGSSRAREEEERESTGKHHDATAGEWGEGDGGKESESGTDSEEEEEEEEEERSMAGLVTAVRSELGDRVDFLEEGEVETMARQRGQMLLLFSDLSRRMRHTGVFTVAGQRHAGRKRSPSPSADSPAPATEAGRPAARMQVKVPPPPRAPLRGPSTAPAGALGPSHTPSGGPSSSSARVRVRVGGQGSGGEAPSAGNPSPPARSGPGGSAGAQPGGGVESSGEAEGWGLESEEEDAGESGQSAEEEEEEEEEDIYASLRRANREEARRAEEKRARPERRPRAQQQQQVPSPALSQRSGSGATGGHRSGQRRARRRTESRRVPLQGRSLGSASQSTALPPVGEGEQGGPALSEDGQDVQATAHVPASHTYRSIFVLDLPRRSSSAGQEQQQPNGPEEGARAGMGSGSGETLWEGDDASEGGREGFAPSADAVTGRGAGREGWEASAAGGSAPVSTPGITAPPSGYEGDSAASYLHVAVPGPRADSAALDGSQWESGSEVWREGGEDIAAPIPPRSAGDAGHLTVTLQSPIRVGRMGPGLESEIDGLLRKHSRLLTRHQNLAGQRRRTAGAAAAAASTPHLRHGTAPQLPRRLSRHPTEESGSSLWPLAMGQPAAERSRGQCSKRPEVRYRPGLLTRETASARGSSASTQLPAAVTLRSLAARRGPWSGRGGGGQWFAGSAVSRRGGGFSQDMAATEEDGGGDAAYSLPMLRRAGPNRRSGAGLR